MGLYAFLLFIVMSVYSGYIFLQPKEGRTTMKLENYEMHLPSYSIGDKIYDKIGPV